MSTLDILTTRNQHFAGYRFPGPWNDGRGYGRSSSVAWTHGSIRPLCWVWSSVMPR